jgi:hypothetical protein
VPPGPVEPVTGPAVEPVDAAGLDSNAQPTRPVPPAAAGARSAAAIVSDAPAVAPGGAVQPPPGRSGDGSPAPTAHERHAGCTTAQLRRFIKSRAYVPMHEIRRRFLIATQDDDVSGIELDGTRIFVGLPEREGQMLGELLRGGEVGYELQVDPVAPVVVGVYPMRPVTRN